MKFYTKKQAVNVLLTTFIGKHTGLELLREECAIEPKLTQPMEQESSELMAIFITMINRTKGK